MTPDRSGRTPAIVVRDGLVGCCFGLFAFLGQSHTAEPFTGMEFRSWPTTEGTEAVLLGIIDLLHARGGLRRARLLPWPEGVNWVLNVRHDMDRAPTPSAAADLVHRHASAAPRPPSIGARATSGLATAAPRRATRATRRCG